MKYCWRVSVLLLVASHSFSDTYATTEDGTRVVLKDDGSWEPEPVVEDPNAVGADKLHSLQEILVHASFEKRLSWSYAFNLQSKDPMHQPVWARAVPPAIDSWLLWMHGNKPEDDKLLLEAKLIEKYRGQIDTLFTGLGLALGEFFIRRNEEGVPVSVPTRIATWQDELALVLTGAVHRQTYSTQRTTPKQRATQTIESVILPSLPAFLRASFGSEIQYFGIVAMYGSHDFSDDSFVNEMGEMNEIGEMVALVVDRESCEKFATGELAQEDLLAQAAVFLADRDMGFNVKRIKVQIE